MNKDLYRAAVDDIKVDENLIRELTIKMKEKPRRWKRHYSIAAASLAVIILTAAFIYSKTGMVSDKKIAQLTVGDSITLSKGKDTIYINKIEGISSGKLFIPEGAYTKEYTIDKLSDVFGRNPIPKIPEAFKTTSNTTSITFDAQGKMLFMSAISYSMDINNPEAASINIKLNKNTLPPKDCLYNNDTVKESAIGSTKVLVGAMPVGNKSYIYSAEFIYKEIGYNITVKSTEGETFIDLLKSIIR